MQKCGRFSTHETTGWLATHPELSAHGVDEKKRAGEEQCDFVFVPMGFGVMMTFFFLFSGLREIVLGGMCTLSLAYRHISSQAAAPGKMRPRGLVMRGIEGDSG